ncbi:MAG: DsbA family oxidoreductase [Sphingomonadales bacterium]|nr:DsbA family oxidoreductase [Sphingomonadales bacterium]MBD3774559.1 DsbA family oxidoreductase [Paracoccaceae bacterium]
MSARLRIDIWSDVMCPWCVVGYYNLATALRELADEIEAEIRWQPFELNPDMPAEGEGQVEHIARKYGRTLEQAESGGGTMRAAMQEAGFDPTWPGEGDPPPAMMWNTFEAHRLLRWVLVKLGPGVQTQLKLALFAAHFRDRRRIGERAVLLDIAESCGVDRAEADAALDDPALAQAVRVEERHAYDANITGVPAMVVQGQFLIPGAQPPETYAQLLRRIAAKLGEAA